MQTWEHIYELTSPCTLEVDQLDGALRVMGWEKQAVQVKASWPGEGRIEDRLDVEVNANLITLKVKAYRSGLLGLFPHDSRLDLEIYVPLGTRCELETGSGPLSVESTRGQVGIDAGSGRVTVVDVAELNVDAGSGGVQVRQVAGQVHVESGSGRIDLETVVGPVFLEGGSGSVAARRIGNGLQAETGSGSITVADVEGNCSFETGSGSIHVARIINGEVHVETGSGSTRLEALDVRGLFVEAGSGSVEVELVRIHPDGHYEFETGSGRVVVAVPPTAGFNLEMETHGRVDYGGFPVKILHKHDDEIHAIVGAGGPLFAVETGSGSISLRPYHGPTPANAEVASTRLAGLVKEDPALEQSEQMARILKMVQEGKLTVEEAEQLLRVLDGEEA